MLLAKIRDERGADVKKTAWCRAVALAAATAWTIAAISPAHAALDRDPRWTVVIHCLDVGAGTRSVVWGYAIALGPAAVTGITCRIDGAVACSTAMPGPVATCSESRPSAAVGLPGGVCGEGWAEFADGTTAEAHAC